MHRSLRRWCKMRSTPRGSVIGNRGTIRMRTLQVRGTVSKILRIRRAHVLGGSVEKSELSRSPARMPGAGMSARAGPRALLSCRFPHLYNSNYPCTSQNGKAVAQIGPANVNWESSKNMRMLVSENSSTLVASVPIGRTQDDPDDAHPGIETEHDVGECRRRPGRLQGFVLALFRHSAANVCRR